MGILANYMMVDEAALDRLVNLDNTRLIEQINQMEQQGAQIYSMDKLWDGLHFVLTGVSASAPVEGNPLSEAVVGVHVFNESDEDADFVGCTELDELPPVLAALEGVDLAALQRHFDPGALKRAGLYPNIWQEQNRDSLWKELQAEYTGLLEFYHKARKAGRHVVISIL